MKSSNDAQSELERARAQIHELLEEIAYLVEVVRGERTGNASPFLVNSPQNAPDSGSLSIALPPRQR